MMERHKLTGWLACGALLAAFSAGSLVFGQAGANDNSKDPATTAKGKKHHKGGHHRQPNRKKSRGKSPRY
jgi:hypothetical protein